MLLKNKVVIVTGASKGLGVAIAEECAGQGAAVVLAARSEDKLEEVRARIESSGGTATAVRCDVADLEQLGRLVTSAVDTYGRVDGLVNNAGVNFVKPFLETTEAEWDHVVDIDLKGSFFLSQYCARQMVSQEPAGGSIVQIASVHTLASVEGAAPYDAAKRGMVGFTKAAAIELGKYNVRMNILSPGLCRTEIWNALVSAAPSKQECLDYWNSNIPNQRLIEPEEIGKSCVFLLSDLSSCITGANLKADCGMTSQLVSREPYASESIVGE